jgi:hypothetical protein
MKCPHCLTEIFSTPFNTQISILDKSVMTTGSSKGSKINPWISTVTCPKCFGATFTLTLINQSSVTMYKAQVFPRGGNFAAAPQQVPAHIAEDYSEANQVLPISPKASAALSRRCLQAVLSSHGYRGRDLVKQIEAVLNETDASKSLPTAIRDSIDAIRNFGNFSAHPITDQNTLEIIDVDEGEAEWCLEILLALFDHYYVAPAIAADKRAALAAKLTAAGKPPMK